MMNAQVAAFQACFDVVDDPRLAGRTHRTLESILFLVVAAVICGADGPVEIEDFGISKNAWLQKFIDLRNGVLSHDTIGRVLSLSKPSMMPLKVDLLHLVFA